MKIRKLKFGLLGLTTCVVMSLALMACGGSSSSSSTSGAGSDSGSKPSALTESGDSAIANDTSGSGGTLRIAMTAGNIPIPDEFVTEGGEGVRFVGKNIYD